MMLSTEVEVNKNLTYIIQVRSVYFLMEKRNTRPEGKFFWLKCFAKPYNKK